MPDHQHLRRHRGRRLLPRRRPGRAAEGLLARRSGRWAWTWTCSTRTASRCAARSASWSAAALAGNDARHLAGPGALPRDLLVALSRRLAHGDWAVIDEDGYWFLHGRSDDTLNVAGKRIGPAEVESARWSSHRPSPKPRRSAFRTRSRARCRGVFVVLKPGAEATAADVTAAVSRRARQGVRAGPGAVRARASEDPLREDRAPRREGDGARKRPGRPLDAREPRGARGNPQCR